MDSIKTLIVVAVLAGVSYAVYVSLNRNPDLRANLTPAPEYDGTNAGQSAEPTPTRQPQVSIPASSSMDEQNVSTAGYSLTVPGSDEAESPTNNPLSSPTAIGALSDPTTGTPTDTTPGQYRPYEDFMRDIRAKLDNGELATAHAELSDLYKNSRLTPQQLKEVTDLLLQLAGTVIYSNRHLLEAPYTVQPGETIEQIAERYNVPSQLLSRVNLIRDGEQPRPGTQLKVFRGPFSAVVDLHRYELVLMLNGLYAGRINIGIGANFPTQKIPGPLTVRGKIPNPAYDGQDTFIAAGEPDNPFGTMLLDLGLGVALHGTNDPAGIGRREGRGMIRVSNSDMEDLARILSVGSEVLIMQ